LIAPVRVIRQPLGAASSVFTSSIFAVTVDKPCAVSPRRWCASRRRRRDRESTAIAACAAQVAEILEYTIRVEEGVAAALVSY